MSIKLPPPLLFIASLAAIYYLPWQISLPLPKTFAWLFGVAASIISLMALWRFYQAKTTVSPLHLAQTTQLVTDGIYRLSRNPMYLSLVLLLIGWTIWLQNLFGIFIIIVFIFCIQQCQIKAEEKILSEKFGEQFQQYQQRVRRWI